MSTTIRSDFGWDLLITSAGGAYHRIATRRPGEFFLGSDFASADFLAAVQSELHVRLVPDDAIVIERGELFAVRPVREELAVGGYYRTSDKEFKEYTAGDARETGLRLLALAEYLDAHPPVDEAQVQALAEVLMDDSQFGIGRGNIALRVARRLVEAGARIEVKP